MGGEENKDTQTTPQDRPVEKVKAEEPITENPPVEKAEEKLDKPV